MKIKKTVMALVLAAAVGIIGVQQASARGIHDMYHGDGSHRQFQQLDDATRAKMEKFHADTQDLRKQMVMKRAEEFALIRSETPNIEAVRKIAGELYDLRMTMQEKAKAAGLFTIPRRDGENGKMAEGHAKLEKFLADTQDLRKQMSIKRMEERALMHSRTPNTEAVAKVAGELFDLRTTIHEKAKTAGLAMPFRGMDHKKMGPGRHFRHGGEFGMMDSSGPQDLGMIGVDEPVDEEDTI